MEKNRLWAAGRNGDANAVGMGISEIDELDTLHRVVRGTGPHLQLHYINVYTYATHPTPHHPAA